MNNFDEIVAGALDMAQTEALKRKNAELRPEHLLWGLIVHPKSVSNKSLKEYKKTIEKLLGEVPVVSGKYDLENLRPTPKFSQWMTYASSHAIQAGRDQIGEADLLRHLPQVLPDIEIDYEKLNSESTEGEQEVPHFLINLNERAGEGKLDPVIGRDKEIRAVMEILGRRRKNNPVLVGPAGVGKTAIVEGLAEAIEKGSVPEVLKGKTIYSLDMGALMAGTKFRGEFEERLQGLLKFIKEEAGQSILFIDEIHQLVGAGKTDGAMDAANLLKPALARGELHCIGATTEDEYQKYIMGDSALARRFRDVPVKEPSNEDAIEILMGIKEKFEIHHGIKISDDAIYNAVLLSAQYITDKNLPDKAIDLIDEAASGMKLSAEAMPPKLVEMEADIRGKKTLSKVEKNNKKILKEIEDLEKTFTTEKAKWDEEVLALKRVSELKNQMDRMKFDLEQAERNQNYEKASEIKYSMLPEVEEQLQKCSHEWILGKKHVGQVIARQTGIPIEKILKTEQENILELEGYLRGRVFGQKNATDEIAGTLVASHAGLTDESRPLGSFLLLGPSGVGKTETAKAISKFLFNTERKMIRLDMSEYSEKHSVAKLIGAPAGYVGYDEGGVLTEAVRRNPYAVILFDEIEKAHPDFADVLLQILDDGHLTDNKGRTVNFKHTSLFLTSNAKDYKAHFKPEVLGRLDAILHYNSLSKEISDKLVDKQINLLNERLSDKKVTIKIDQSLRDTLIDRGFDDDYGARPLQGLFQRLVIRPLSKNLLDGSLKPGAHQAKFLDGQVEFV